jgi:hypothetical protein
MEDINQPVKQIHRDNMNGLISPFGVQQAIHASQFWVNCMYILAVSMMLS